MLKRFTASVIFLAGVIFVILLENCQPDPIELIPSISGDVEFCLTCHQDLPEISASHPVETFGCVSCHGGERLEIDAELAHSTMRGENNPSDLTVVEISCGGDECHSGQEMDGRDHIQRVMTSIQSTYAGAIAAVRYSFGAQEDLHALMGTKAIRDEISASNILSL